MPSRFLRHAITLAAVWAFYLPATSRAQSTPQPAATSKKVDCAAVLNQMRSDFAVDPGRLILALEDALTTREVCVCPVIRTAVDLAGREPGLTSRIVIAAIRNTPAAAARITECALVEAPEAAAAIRAAVSAELGNMAAAWLDHPENGGDSRQQSSQPNLPIAPADGKSPVLGGKTPVHPGTAGAMEPEDEEFWPGVGISGIYLTINVGNRVLRPEKSEIPVLRKVIFTQKSVLCRPSSPVTRDFPE